MFAGVLELVDEVDSKSIGLIPRAGSIPATGTKIASMRYASEQFFIGAPSGRMFQRVKVPNPPGSGKDIAKSKGVLGNWESEGSWRQITGLTNRNHEG